MKILLTPFLIAFTLRVAGQGFEGTITYEWSESYLSKKDSIAWIDYINEANERLQKVGADPVAPSSLPSRTVTYVRNDTLLATEWRIDQSTPYQYLIQISRQGMLFNPENGRLTRLSGPALDSIFDESLPGNWRDSIKIGNLFKIKWEELDPLNRHTEILGYRCRGYRRTEFSQRWGKSTTIYWITDELPNNSQQALAIHFDGICTPLGILLGRDTEGYGKRQIRRAVAIDLNPVGPLKPVLDSINRSNDAGQYYRPIPGNEILDSWTLDLGKTAPDFAFRDVRSGLVRRLHEFTGKGKFVLLEFWGTWCGPCKRLLPHLRQLHEESGELVDIISFNWRDERSVFVRQYIAENRMNWTQGYGTERLIATLNPEGKYPTVLLLNAEGQVVFLGNPLKDWEEVVEGIRP